jgi:YkoY family integral membrane protein
MVGIGPADLPTIIVAISTLVLLEGLLSADNALVLAVMVRHLPKPQQRRALRYGIWGAFIFRLIAVIFASYLLQFWQLKVVGGLYLLYLACTHLLSSPQDEAPGKAAERFGSGFWATVINVEIADIAFSIDSILAAVAMVQGLPPKLQNNRFLALGIVYVGGVLGIVMMRLVAGVFLVLLERFKGLAAGAYYLVGWIGLKLIGGGLHDAFDPVKHPGHQGWRATVPTWLRGFHWDMPDWLFWAGMALIVVASLLYRPRGSGGADAHGPGQSEPTSPDSTADVADRDSSRVV